MYVVTALYSSVTEGFVSRLGADIIYGRAFLLSFLGLLIFVAYIFKSCSVDGTTPSTTTC